MCHWCGIGFLATRPDARTCKPSHRNALAKWVKKHGRKPAYPPASTSVKQPIPHRPRRVWDV